MVKESKIGKSLTKFTKKNSRKVDKLDDVADEVKVGSKTDFYVIPSGDVIPSTGYGYISENATYLDDMTKI